MLGASHKTLPTVVALLAALQGVHSHVFNAIYSALRKWESSINAGGNGMSAYLATLPKGTLLYHGNPEPDVVQGMEL